MKHKTHSPARIYLLIIGYHKLIGSLFATVQMVYFASIVTADPLQLVLIWTVFQTSVLVFEIPTGIVADTYSRKLSVILGFVVIGVGNIVVGGFSRYSLVLLGMFILGIGDTFLSGALDAWIADEIGEEQVGSIYMRGSQIAQVAILAGIPIGTALGTISLSLPMILSGFFYLLLGISLIRVMPEEGFQPIPSEQRTSWQILFQTFREGVQLVRGRSILFSILVISAIAGISTTGFEGLWTAYMLERIIFPDIGNFEPVVWFGIINGTVSIMSLIGMEFFRQKMGSNNQTRMVGMLVATSSLTAIGMLGFGITRNFWWAAGFYSLSYALRIASSPIQMAWINQNIETKVRATILSMDNQVNYMGRMIGGPMIGAIGSTFTLPLALITTGVLRIPIALLFTRMWMRYHHDQDKINETYPARFP